MSTASRHLQRLVATLLVLLWLALPSLQVLHGEHGHRYCAEHQAFEEVAPAAGEPDVASAFSGAALSVADAADPEAAHSACTLLVAQREAGWAPRSAEAFASCAALLLALRPGGRVPVALPLSPLVTAPKASPPA